MADSSADKLRRLEDRLWWPDLVLLKDVLSLRELATRFGAAPAAISNALRRNGLDRQAAPPGPRANRAPDVARAASAALARVLSGEADPIAPAPVAPAPVAVASEPVAAPAEIVVLDEITVPASLTRGYQARIDGQDYVIVAPSIAEAAVIAARSGRGTVTAVDLLGAALGT